MSEESKNAFEKTLKQTYDEITYNDQVGQKATVERQSYSGEGAEYHIQNLKRIGQEIQQAEPKLKDFNHVGSIAVHYYVTPVLKHMTFVSQTGLIDVSELICQSGITDLRNACLSFYGRNQQRKRSGF